ncbi:MAG TPA: hypothetical protein ENK57_14535, partial [Polyangiaceae bacterium]|nr:hypothetical protein [Polyangiaceae bacterium]
MPVAPGDWLAPLLADAPAGLRRFHPDDLHMTVAFLGGCGRERAEAAFATASGHTLSAFAVTLDRLAPMGNPRRPSALSVLVARGHDEAATVMSLLRPAMWEAAGAKPDTRPAKPHITVARPPRKAGAKERPAAVEWATSKPPIGEVLTIDRL